MNADTVVRGERSEILPRERDSVAVHTERRGRNSLPERKGMINYEHERAYRYRFYGHVGHLQTFALSLPEFRCTGSD